MIPRTFIHDCIVFLMAALVVLYIQDAFSGPTEAQIRKAEVRAADKEERKAVAREVATKYESCAYTCFESCRK